jgi:tRNA nucleotidyltransferase (CCA-adding enzyme)
MKVIATHLNADFDGFAAMIGLLKLHPDAVLCFPGSKESALRHFFQESGLQVPVVASKELQDVQHLILVDSARQERFGSIAELLKQQRRPLVEVYDHHPEDQCTIDADHLHRQEYGSTTTIVVLEMMEAAKKGKVIGLTSLEASVMLAGIYEDTANFLSTSTVPEDFRAASYLIEQGAEINVVNRLMTHRMKPEEASFFNALVANCESVKMEGHSLTISPFNWPVFVPEAAYMVHRLLDLEPIDTFFALILMDNRLYIIARSNVPDVDVGSLLAFLGGGGHRMAASAVLKDVTLIEGKEKLLGVLHQNLARREKAADIMKRSLISIPADRNIGAAMELMNTYRINALIVTEGNRVVGTISRQTTDGAAHHGLKERPVRDFMQTELPLMDPDTSADQILKLMVERRTRFVLVGKDPEHVDGIITRMDLMRYHYEVNPQTLRLHKSRKSENLQAMLKKRLPESIFELLKQAGIVSERLGYKVYLVGGMVRDLLLHRENIDLDLVVEGDGIQFASEFAKIYTGEIAAHRRFGTARITFRDGFKMDIATARTESYHAPAALPQVHGGILRQDLYRRDFTINTLAIDLSPAKFGALVDYFGGWDDLHQGVIRVLHSLSFIDDPTRTLRAIRFATRFNFQISDDTQRLIRSAVDSRVLDKLSGKRFWTELRYLLQEQHPIPALHMLHQYKLLSFIHPGLILDSFLLDLLYQVETVLGWYRLNFLADRPANQWLLYLMAMLEKLDRAERFEIAQRFQLTAAIQNMLKSYKGDLRDIHARLLTRQSSGSLYFALREYPLEILLYSMARISEPQIREQITVYLRDLRHVELEINGEDVLQLGIPRGPAIREILDQVLRARLDGTADDRNQQLDLAGQIIRQTTTSGA